MIKFPPVKAIITFIREVRTELSKVTWPKKEEVIKLTLIILIISGIVAGYVGSLDFAFTKLLEVFVAN